MSRVPESFPSGTLLPELQNQAKLGHYGHSSYKPANHSWTQANGLGLKTGSNTTALTQSQKYPRQDWSMPMISSTPTVSHPKQGNDTKNGANSTEAWKRNNTNLLQNQNRSTAHPTLTTPHHIQANVSSTSVPSSTKSTNQSITEREVKCISNSTTNNYTKTKSNKIPFAMFPAKIQTNGLLSQNAKRKFNKLVTHGVSKTKAKKLCSLSWPEIVKQYPSMIDLVPPKKKKNLALYLLPKPIVTTNSQGSATTNTSGQQNLNPQSTLLRVGIQNKEHMKPDQMKLVHRHLLLAITKQFTNGGGPEFLSFTHKEGWIQVTCVDQRSKNWLEGEVKYVEPWPGAQLSIVPEEQLPNPPRVVARIPESEASSVQEALDLLKAQNKGLNTGHWQVLHERVDKDKSRIVTFLIDDKSLDILNAQNLEAALGFKMVTFRVKAGGSHLLPATSGVVDLSVADQDGLTLNNGTYNQGETSGGNRSGATSQEDSPDAELSDMSVSPDDDEEGGYSSWIIQEPESFQAGIPPGLNFINSEPQSTVTYAEKLIQDASVNIGADRDNPQMPGVAKELHKSYTVSVNRSRTDRERDRHEPYRLSSDRSYSKHQRYHGESRVFSGWRNT
ncbi:uncharacterized protein LOC125238608 [Leguminivora glycinivorella]|uniref:uncharacterized protein LOC125238608 n=1 Tax=Leguminivora glycinivorella TaxID=1035111 RepID=UPI00200C15E2|nr:uncharacterized protein LOC125238608 [Leguminivora glycinivorella]